MSEQQNKRLDEAIQSAAGRIRKFQDRNLGEQNTKASLVEPVLEALGWDVRDPDEVHREYKPTTRDSPVDYALNILRKPRLFVEGKGLGETLSDRKWIAQVLGYAIVAGVEWCVLTDGGEYRFYNATAPIDAEEKLFCRVRLTEDEPGDVARTLTLISRGNMEENLLDVLWIAHFVDRRVKQAVQEMFSSTDKSLVRIIRQREPKLSPKDIVESLRRLDVRIESLTPVPEPKSKAQKTSSPPRIPVPKDEAERRRAAALKAAATRRSRQPVTKDEAQRAEATKTKKHFGVSLSDVIGSGFLTPPLKLFRKYKGEIMEATLLSDGSVEMRGTRYQSCSTAAEIARSFVTGQPMHTNGWDFWQFVDAKGKKATLFDAREKYLASRKEG